MSETSEQEHEPGSPRGGWQGDPRPGGSCGCWHGPPGRGHWQEVRRRAAAMASSGPDMRVGDTERSAMADLLSKHYAEGRLDESEFGERMDRAMGAKTRGDLSGLLYDLPPLQGPPAAAPRRHGGGLVLLVVLVLALGSWLFSPHRLHAPWPVQGLVGTGWSLLPVHWVVAAAAVALFVLLRRRRWRRHSWQSEHSPRTE